MTDDEISDILKTLRPRDKLILYGILNLAQTPELVPPHPAKGFSTS